MSARQAPQRRSAWASALGALVVTISHASSSFGGRSCVLHNLFPTTQGTTEHRLAPDYLCTYMQRTSLDFKKCCICSIPPS